jgi:hypothetical protein
LAKCALCDEQAKPSITCPYCGKTFCIKHGHPEQHICGKQTNKKPDPIKPKPQKKVEKTAPIQKNNAKKMTKKYITSMRALWKSWNKDTIKKEYVMIVVIIGLIGITSAYGIGKRNGNTHGFDDGYFNGSSIGFDEGFVYGSSIGDDVGNTDGNSIGYDDGIKFGDKIGERKGLDKGYLIGYNNGYLNGKEVGINDEKIVGEQVGIKDGKIIGALVGEEDGFDEGFLIAEENGIIDGENVGFDEGFLIAEADYTVNYSIGYERSLEYLNGHVFNVRNPSYTEMKSFLRKDRTDRKRYVTGVFDCEDYSSAVIQNSFESGYYCFFVHVEQGLPWVHPDHAIVAFNTSDRGWIFVEPQHDDIVRLNMGESYAKSNGYKTPREKGSDIVNGYNIYGGNDFE